jgi:hypothetical protein
MPLGSAGHFDRQNGDLGFCFGCVWPICKTPVSSWKVQALILLR